MALICAVAVAGGHGIHGGLHQIGAPLVDALELGRVQRRLEVIAAPDVMNAAFAADQQLIDIGRRLAAGIVGSDIAFLMAAHAHAAAAWPADIAGRQRDVHQRLVGAVIVVAPDQSLLVSEHGAPPGAALLRLGDPLGRLADILGLQAGDLRGLLDRGVVRLDRVVVAAGAGRDEARDRPSPWRRSR